MPKHTKKEQAKNKANRAGKKQSDANIKRAMNPKKRTGGRASGPSTPDKPAKRDVKRLLTGRKPRIK